MEIHRQLAELVDRAGAAVLDDADGFRAAVDDFLTEGAASEGEINLLADAVRLGALRRVLDQVDHGADVGRAIDAQAVRLAEQRGTRESSGAHWALTVLCFALGRLGEDAVSSPNRSTSSRAGETAAPAVVAAPQPPAAPPGQVPPSTAPPTTPTPPPASVADTILPVRPGSTRSDSGRPRRRGRWAFAALGLVVVVAGAVTAVVLWPRSQQPPASDERPEPVPTGTVVTAGVAPPPPAPRPVVMASRAGGVSVTAFGPVEEVGTEADALVAADGDRWVAFTLAAGPCQLSTCADWSTLGLQVVIDDRAIDLPRGGPTYAVAAPAEATVELRFDALGYDQRVSLLDGSATGQNIEVLTRGKRSVRIDASKVVPLSADKPIGTSHDEWTARIGGARLSFFVGDKGPGRADRAYLELDVTYTDEGSSEPSLFLFDDLRFEGPDRQRYRRVDTDPGSERDVVFLVPADFTSGTLIVGNTRTVTSRTSTGGTSSLELTLRRTAFRVEVPAG